MDELTYRQPRPEELADCALVWHAAVDDYMSRLGRPLPPPVLDPLVTLMEHLLRTDPTRFLIAVRRVPRPRRRDEVVGFGIALQRDQVWFLSQLYVLPAFQGTGVGRSILTRILPSLDSTGHAGSPGRATAPGPPGVLATATDTAQPISNGLYSGYGIVPRMPVFNLVGRPIDARTLPPLRPGVEAVPFRAFAEETSRPRADRGDRSVLGLALDAIDLEILGYARAVDHRHFRQTDRLGYVYRDAGGAVVGYGYTSAVGRLGPVAILDETLWPGVLTHLLTIVEPRGATSVWVPGANDRAIVALLRAGLRFEGFPALLCWTRPFASFERYVPTGLALL